MTLAAIILAFCLVAALVAIAVQRATLLWVNTENQGLRDQVEGLQEANLTIRKTAAAKSQQLTNAESEADAALSSLRDQTATLRRQLDDARTERTKAQHDAEDYRKQLLTATGALASGKRAADDRHESDAKLVNELTLKVEDYRHQLHDVRNKLQTEVFKGNELAQQLRAVREAAEPRTTCSGLVGEHS